MAPFNKRVAALHNCQQATAFKLLPEVQNIFKITAKEYTFENTTKHIPEMCLPHLS